MFHLHQKRHGKDWSKNVDKLRRELGIVINNKNKNKNENKNESIYVKPPKMNILIMIVGSRGDVQPFIALGQQLKKDGHNVRLATHQVFEKFVMDKGLKFFPIGGDPAELMAYMTKNPGLIPSMESVRNGDIGRKRKTIKAILNGCWKACTMPDPKTNEAFQPHAIISNPVTFGHVHCAEKLKIPLHVFFTMPWSPTKEFPHPLAQLSTENGARQVNKMSFAMVENLTWSGLGDLINGFRVKKLGLDPIPMQSLVGPKLLSALKVPHTYCWSPSFIPKPKDWGDEIDVCGFFFLDLATNFKPPADLDAFLKAGPPPVYIGFGSIVVEDPEALLQKVLDGVQKVKGLRAIISSGWGGLSAKNAPKNVFFIGNCPHDWLFQRVSAVICHGGAGTTAAALRAKKPVFVIPFFGDQPFWGGQVSRAGAGPSPVPHGKLTSDKLANGIKVCLQQDVQDAAARIGEEMFSENGLKNGVDSFYRHLPLDKMRCDLDPSKSADFFNERKKLQLSTSCLAQLEEKGLVKSRCRKNESKTYPIPELCASSGFVAGSIRGANRSVHQVLDGFTDFVVEPARGYKKGSMSGGMFGFCKGTSKMIYKGCDSPLIFFEETCIGAYNFSTSIDPRKKDNQKIAFKPKNTLQGTGMGCKYLVKGCVEGFVDAFALPVKGAYNHGFIGSIEGLTLGICSAATKPAAGVGLFFTMPFAGLRHSLLSPSPSSPSSSSSSRRGSSSSGSSRFSSSSSSSNELLVRTN